MLRLVAVLLVVGNVSGRALQAGDGQADDLGEFSFSTGAWLKDVRKANITEPKASPSPKESVTKPQVVDVGSVAGASVCKSIRVGSSDAWCDGNCVMTPASSFCTLSCHCPGWNAKPEVTKAKSARNDVACISKNYQLSTDSWCNDNCVGFLGEGGESHDQECDETCECTAKLKAAADARMAKAEAKVAKVAKVAKAEAKASPAPKGGVCESISEEAPAAWCDKTCQADPNAAWCVKVCRCPGFSEAKVKALCKSVSEATPASWCQETCADTPDTKQCAMMCHCPGWKAANVQPLRAPPKPAAADPAPQPKQTPTPKDVQAPGPQPVQAPAPQPVQQSMKPQTFDKVCKRKIGSSVSADWCDRSCASTPNSDECKSVCDCPSLSAKPAKVEKAVKAKCVSSNDLGLGDIEAAAQWCDQNCMNDPGAQWCRPCKCPKMSAL